MASTLEEILNDPEFQAASPAVQLNVRQSFFDDVVSQDEEFKSATPLVQGNIQAEILGISNAQEPQQADTEPGGTGIVSQGILGALDLNPLNPLGAARNIKSLLTETEIGRKATDKFFDAVELSRTLTVGAGGALEAARETLLTGSPSAGIIAGAESIEQRRGLGEELIAPFMDEGTIKRGLAGFVLEMVTDPVNYVTFNGVVKVGNKFVKAARSSETSAALISAASRVAKAEKASGVTAKVEHRASTILRNIAKKSDELVDINVKIANVEAAGKVTRSSLAGEVLDVQQRAGLISERVSKQESNLRRLNQKRILDKRRVNEQLQRLKNLSEKVAEPKTGGIKRSERVRLQNVRNGLGKDIKRLESTERELSRAHDDLAKIKKDADIKLKKAAARSGSLQAESSVKQRVALARSAELQKKSLHMENDLHKLQDDLVRLRRGGKESMEVVEAEVKAAKQVGSVHPTAVPDSMFGGSKVGSQMVDLIRESPDFAARIAKQNRIPVTRAESRSAGEALRADLSDFAALKPGELLERGTLDAQRNAAKDVQLKAGSNLAALGRRVANGESVQSLTKDMSVNLEAIVGSFGVEAEVGRGLSATVGRSAFERAQGKLLRDAIERQIFDDPDKAAKFLQELAALPADRVKQQLIATNKFLTPENKILAGFSEFRSASLLWLPKTFLRNFVGNKMAIVARSMETAIGSFIDPALSKVLRLDKSLSSREVIGQVAGSMGGIKRAARDGLEVLLDESSTKGFGSEFATKSPVIPGTLGRFIRFPFRVLNADDTFSKMILFNGEIHRLAHNAAIVKEGLEGSVRDARIAELINKPPDDMVGEAIRIAKEFTFQETLTGALGDVNKALNSNSLIAAPFKFVIPYFKTPVNIVRFMARRTPVIAELTESGIVRSYVKARTGKATSAAVSDAVARNVVGLGAMTTSAYAVMALEGRVTGKGPSNFRERRILMDQGWRPFSVKMGDSYVSYAGFEPIASWLGTVADFVERHREGDGSTTSDEIKSIVLGTINNFTNQPFLKGIRDLLDVMTDPDIEGALYKFNRFATTSGQSLIPSLFTPITRTIDPGLRQPDGFVEGLLSKIPFASKLVRPRQNRFGQNIKLKDNIVKAIIPFDTPEVLNPIIEDELKALDAPFKVGPMSSRLNGRKLSKDNYNKINRVSGRILASVLTDMIQSPEYQDLEPHERIKEIVSVTKTIRGNIGKEFAPLIELEVLGIDDDFSEEEIGFIQDAIEAPAYKKMKSDKEKAEAIRFVLKDFRNSR